MKVVANFKFWHNNRPINKGDVIDLPIPEAMDKVEKGICKEHKIKRRKTKEQK